MEQTAGGRLTTSAQMLLLLLLLSSLHPAQSSLLAGIETGGCGSDLLSAALSAVMVHARLTEVTVPTTSKDQLAAVCLTRRLWAAGVATSHAPVAAVAVEHAQHAEHSRSTLAVLGTAEDVVAAYRRAWPPGPAHRATWFLGVRGAASEEAVAPLAAALQESQSVTVVFCESEAAAAAAAAAACRVFASSSPGDGSVRLTEVGSATAGRVTLKTQPPDWRLRHLGGRPLTVLLDPSGKPHEPCTEMLLGYRPLSGGGAHLCGYLGQTLQLLTSKLRFRVVVKKAKSCGMVFPNGSAYGRLAALQRGEADLGVGSCTVMYERLRAVDMAEWHWTDTTTFMTAAPQPLRPPLLIFQVYRPAVWALVLALAPAAAALRWLSGSAERRCHVAASPRRHTTPGRHSPRRQTWPTLLLESVAMLAGQGVEARGAGAASRTLVFFLYVVMVSVAAVYAGNLTAFLSLPRWQPPIDSLEQLADSAVQPHVVRGHSQFHLFRNQTTGVRGRIWAKMTACDDCIHRSSTSTHKMSFLRRMASGEVTVFQSPRALTVRARKYMTRTRQTNGDCPFHLARENLRRDFYAMMLQKNSKYTPLFDDAIRWLKQFGVIQYLYRRNVPSTCADVTAGAVSRHATLDLYVLRGAFFCWLAGMAAGCAALAAELCCHLCLGETVCDAVLQDQRRRQAHKYAPEPGSDRPASGDTGHRACDPMLRQPHMFEYEIREAETNF